MYGDDGRRTVEFLEYWVVIVEVVNVLLEIFISLRRPQGSLDDLLHYYSAIKIIVDNSLFKEGSAIY